MISTRRGFLRGLLTMAALTALPLPAARASAAARVATGAAPAVATRSAEAGAWTLVGPTGGVGRLFAPASGALFAATDFDLFRSDDGGASWRQVELPPTRRTQRTIAVDPTNHQTIYVESNDGLQRTTDDTASWSLILPTDRHIRRAAVSPADPGIVYVEHGGDFDSDHFFLASLDQGATWAKREEGHYSLCGWSTPILTPHPTDPARLFRSAGCYAGRDLSDTLDESRDNAATFTEIFKPKGAFPSRIVGGSGAEPGRFYLASNNDPRGGGSDVFVSTDDGATWSSILTNAGGGTMTGNKAPNVTISSLTYDPSMPGRVFVGLARHDDPWKPAANGGLLTTTDGGASWTDVGQPELPRVDDLVMGIDGRNLYAATDAGVWRLALA